MVLDALRAVSAGVDVRKPGWGGSTNAGREIAMNAPTVDADPHA